MLLADILARLRALPEIAGWPEALAYAAGAVDPGGHPLWSYPVAACTSVGGDEEQALPAAAAVFSALASIRLVDDLLDDDPHGEFRRIGWPGGEPRPRLPRRVTCCSPAVPPAPSVCRAAGALRADAAATARGQALDSREPADEDGYWTAVAAKTPPRSPPRSRWGRCFGGGSPPRSRARRRSAR